MQERDTERQRDRQRDRLTGRHRNMNFLPPLLITYLSSIAGLDPAPEVVAGVRAIRALQVVVGRWLPRARETSLSRRVTWRTTIALKHLDYDIYLMTFAKTVMHCEDRNGISKDRNAFPKTVMAFAKTVMACAKIHILL
jgi:hypothetical protein